MRGANDGGSNEKNDVECMKMLTQQLRLPAEQSLKATKFSPAELRDLPLTPQSAKYRPKLTLKLRKQGCVLLLKMINFVLINLIF